MTATHATQTHSAASLKNILLFDATTCILMGAALLLGSEALGRLLQLPAPFLFWAGALLFPCAVLMLFTALRAPVSATLTWLVIIGNLAWVVASVLNIEIWLSPNLLGAVFVLAQAAMVVVLAWLEYAGLKAARPE